jgi:hypothetical protein
MCPLIVPTAPVAALVSLAGSRKMPGQTFAFDQFLPELQSFSITVERDLEVHMVEFAGRGLRPAADSKFVMWNR